MWMGVSTYGNRTTCQKMMPLICRRQKWAVAFRWILHVEEFKSQAPLLQIPLNRIVTSQPIVHNSKKRRVQGLPYGGRDLTIPYQACHRTETQHVAHQQQGRGQNGEGRSKIGAGHGSIVSEIIPAAALRLPRSWNTHKLPSMIAADSIYRLGSLLPCSR